MIHALLTKRTALQMPLFSRPISLVARCGAILALATLGACSTTQQVSVHPMAGSFDETAAQTSDLRIAESALQSGDLDVAKPIYARLTQTHPDMPQAWMGLADVHFLAGELQAAQQTYALVAARFPTQVDALLGLARIALRQRELETAAATYARVLEQWPEHPLALAGLGVTMT